MNTYYFSLKMHNKAFTLIELLVVIVIIGILATISVSTFNGYLKRTRDAKRIQQFTEAVNLIKQYVITNEKFPVLSWVRGCGGWRVVNKDHKAKIIEFGKNFQYDFTEDYYEDCKGFNFYIYSAGYAGCPREKGRFMIFTTSLEQIDDGKTASELGLGSYEKFVCPKRIWRGGHRGKGLVFGIFADGSSSY